MDAELLPGVDYFLIGETVSDTAVSAMPFVELRDSSTSPIAWLNTQIETIATSVRDYRIMIEYEIRLLFLLGNFTGREGVIALSQVPT